MSDPGLIILVWEVPWRICNEQEQCPMFFETHWQLGGHLSSQVHPSSCWVHPCLGEGISPYPKFWLHSRFLLLDWLRLAFEEIKNCNRLTEQHFFHYPSSECSHSFGIFVDESSNFNWKRHWTMVMFFVCLFVFTLELGRDHTQSYI